MSYYMKGQSDFDSVNFHMGLFFDMNGFPSGDYATVVMPDDATQGDPFLAIAAETIPTWTPGSAVVEMGLWDDYRIKVDTAGIWGWHEGSGDWFSLFGGGGGASALVDLTDVVIVTPADNEVLAYDSSTSKWINQTAAEASLATAGHGHGQLHDQNHDNTDHTTNYHTEADGTGAVTVHSGITDAGSGIIISDAERTALHVIYTLEQHDNTYHSTNYEPAFTKNQAFNKDWGTTSGTVAQGDDSRFHTPTVAGDLDHNDLANIDADDIKHLTATQLGALHTIYSLESHNNTYHSVTFVDAAGAVQAVEDAGLVMENPIDMQTNLLTVGDSTDTSDPITLIEFQTERAWYLRKRSTGASTNLNLECDTSGKSFTIGYTDSPIMGFYTHSTDSSQTINAYSHKITSLANGSDPQDAMAFGQKYTLEAHNNTYHSTNYHTEADGTGAVTVHSDITSVGSGAIITTGERTALHAESHDFDTHSGDVDLADIGSYVQGRLIIGGASDWTALTAGTSPEVLKMNISGEPFWELVDWDELFGKPSTFTPSAHAMSVHTDEGDHVTHNYGSGANTVCQGNDSRLSDARTPTSHAGSHQNTGGDEINVGNLSGVLADAQIPVTHQLATSGGIPRHTGPLPLTDIGSYSSQGQLIIGGASDWTTLSKGSDGKFLKAGASTISWEDVPGAPIETGSTFPVSPVDGQTYYDHEDECTYIYSTNALAWVQIGGAGVGGGTIFKPPIGYITMYSGTWVDNSTIPGWYKCDGNNGTVNLVGKFVRGGTTSGSTGGSDNAVLVSHVHDTQTAGSGSGAVDRLDHSATYSTSTTINSNSSGEGESGTGKNIPAYYQLIFIQRIS